VGLRKNKERTMGHSKKVAFDSEMEAVYQAYKKRDPYNVSVAEVVLGDPVYDHFPTNVKDRLRFLSAATNVSSDARQLHEFLSKTRSPLFT
jgi:hypothetical protein